MAPGLGPFTAARIREQFAGRSLMTLTERELADELDLSDVDARRITQALASVDAWAELRRLRRLDGRITAPGGAGWPSGLDSMDPPPPALWYRGPAPSDERTVAIVGSRRCGTTAIGRTEVLARTLASQGWTIVSGGAMGADAAAHRGALRAGGRTIVVLGAGLAHAGPGQNERLFDAVLEAGGTIASEWPVDTTPTPGRFPRRNRIIAGLSRAVIVTAAARRSGSAITARYAAEHGARDIGVIPGAPEDPEYAGCLALARDGAIVVRDAEDVLELLGTNDATL